jgi:multidrug resistance efflux pump
MECRYYVLAILAICSTSVQGSEPEPLYGAILAAEKVDLSFRRDGVIDAIHIRTGDSVEAGQLVIQIDDREYRARVALATSELDKSRAVSEDESSVLAARAQLARAEAAWKTHAALKQKSDLELFRLEMDKRERQAAFEMALAKHRQDAIDVAIKEEMQNLARLDLESCQVVSPIAGVVAEQWKHVGEAVRSGESILRIQRMDELEFRVELSDRVMPPERLGNMDAEIIFFAESDDPISLKGISFDRVIPSNLDDEHYYAIARIENQQVQDSRGNPHWRLRPGMSGEVRLQAREDHAPQSKKKWISSPNPSHPNAP